MGAAITGITTVAGCVDAPDIEAIPEAIGTDGHLVYVSSSANGTIDPSSTDTPVQDALGKINQGANDAGMIWLPAGEITEKGPLTGLARVSVIGTGIGYGREGEHSTTVTIDGGGDGILQRGYDDLTWTYLHNFTLKAHDRTDGRAAIRFDGSYNPRNFNMGLMRFQNWTESTKGVISLEGSNPWSCWWGSLMFSATAGSAIYTENSGLSIAIGQVYVNPRDTNGQNYGIEVNGPAAPRWHIQIFNLDTYIDKAIHTERMTKNGYMYVGHLNFEPTRQSSVEEAVYLNGTGYVHLDHVQVTGSGLDITRGVNLAGCGNVTIGGMNTAGDVEIANNWIEVTETPIDYSWYFGSESDISNIAGSDTGYVRSMETAGTGNG